MLEGQLNLLSAILTSKKIREENERVLDVVTCRGKFVIGNIIYVEDLHKHAYI